MRKSEVAEPISFYSLISPLPPIPHGWSVSIPRSPDIIDIDDTRLQEMRHTLDTDEDDEDTYHNLTAHVTK
jgi:hypothetical protein